MIAAALGNDMSSPVAFSLANQLLQNDKDVWAAKLSIKDQILEARGALDVVGQAEQLLEQNKAANQIRSGAFAVEQKLPGKSSAAASFGLDAWAQQQQPGNNGTDQDIAASVLAAAQRRWQRLLLERLHAAQMLLPTIPLASAPRSAEALASMRDEVADLEDAWERIGSSASPFTREWQSISVSKLLYDAADVLEAVRMPTDVALRQQSSQEASNSGGGVSLLGCVRSPSRMWLQSFFADLKADKRQVGLDDMLHPWFREEQVDQAQRVLSASAPAACRAAARSGLPASARPHVWACALGLAGLAKEGLTLRGFRSPSRRDEDVLEVLCEGVEQQRLLLDALICSDVNRMVDSENYFVFEESLRAIMLAFSRDASIGKACAVQPAPRLAAETKDGKLIRPYPPSGLLPYNGLAAYAAPLCYLYDHPAAVYRIFSALYCRYWSVLHTLNIKGAPGAGLPVLCKTFVDLLQELDPPVTAHLDALGHSALDVAFPWMFSAFVGYLSPSETLLLWDRIIGFDSLLVLPVLAVAVMTFRRDLVLSVESADELIEVMEDLSQLRVVPLLQALLFDS
eukprot:jgi/Chrzof1/13236/Cz07g25210.t1